MMNLDGNSIKQFSGLLDIYAKFEEQKKNYILAERGIISAKKSFKDIQTLRLENAYRKLHTENKHLYRVKEAVSAISKDGSEATLYRGIWGVI